MHIHVLVEGASEKALLEGFLPRFQPRHSHTVHAHQGKGNLPVPGIPVDQRHRGLLDQLPAKLRAFGKSLSPAVELVLVLVDADSDGCEELKARIVAVLDACDPRPTTMIRVAVEETEAFYLGDKRAIHKAFGTVRRAPYSTYGQDSVCGTWEVFQAVIGAPYDAKVRWAEKIAPHLSIAVSGKHRNRSPSFRQLCAALQMLAGER
jgi:hypothetical protein